MIYTVTLNPSLDYIVSVKDFRLGLTNRTESEQLIAGGKGINISIVLKNLGIENTALGFVAGFTGEEIIQQIESRGVSSDFVRVAEGTSRINIKLRDMEGTEINGCGPQISGQEMDSLLKKLMQLNTGDVLFLAGSIPYSMPKDVYKRILEMLQEKAVTVVVDATKDLLLKILPYNPFLVKPNNHELGELFGVQLNTRQEVIPYGQKLQEMGAQNVLISLAGEGAVLISANGQVMSEPAPKGQVVNSVGAGDSMVAGFMAAWLEEQDYRYAFLRGIATGSASAFSENLATEQEIDVLYNQLKTRRRENADL